MKRVFLVIVALTMLCVMSKAQSWTQIEASRTLVHCDMLTTNSEIKVSKWDQSWSTSAFEFQYVNGLVHINAGSYPVAKVMDVRPCQDINTTVSGLLLLNASDYFREANISAGREGNNFITKIRLHYYSLGNSRVKVVTQATSTINVKSDYDSNGLLKSEAEIIPKVPVQTVYLGLSNVTLNTASQLTKYLGRAVDGVIITDITVEYIDDYYAAEKEVKTFAENYAAGQAALKLDAADVNRDGTINAADVVEVYNSIINGGKE